MRIFATVFAVIVMSSASSVWAQEGEGPMASVDEIYNYVKSAESLCKEHIEYNFDQESKDKYGRVTQKVKIDPSQEGRFIWIWSGLIDESYYRSIMRSPMIDGSTLPGFAHDKYNGHSYFTYMFILTVQAEKNGRLVGNTKWRHVDCVVSDNESEVIGLELVQ